MADRNDASSCFNDTYELEEQQQLNLSGQPRACERAKLNHRYRPSDVARQNTRPFLQSSTGMAISEGPFQLLVLKIARDVNLPSVTSFQSTAIKILMEAAEAFLVSTFEEANVCAALASRNAVTARDLALARRLRGG